MNYITQLSLLLMLGFGTLAWKVNRAIGKERNSPVQEEVESNLSWPAKNFKATKKEISTFFLTVLCFFSFATTHADFSADKYAGCPPLIVNFTNLSIGNCSWFWDFGNGNTSAFQNPSATFFISGTYRVKLIIRQGTQVDSVIRTIRVFALPVVNFIADKTTACINDSIHFQSNVIAGDAPVTRYAWGFGNGIAGSDSNVDYSYRYPGAYNVTLIVQDSNGCTANKTIPGYIHVFALPRALFTASPLISCNITQSVVFTNQSTGAGLTYSWNLGDSTYSALSNPVHLYQQGIRYASLLVTDSNGCIDKHKVRIKVMDLAADFSLSAPTRCQGERMTFSNTSNFPGTSWHWNFGDGTTSTDCNPVKIYSSPGTYYVSLRISDGPCSDSITRPVIIQSGFSVNTPSFSADSTTSCGTALGVNFTNHTPGGAHFLWNFGNGETSNLENPSVTFPDSGIYTVSLTVTDSNGCSITATRGSYIQTSKPRADFLADTVACKGGATLFANRSICASSFRWNFGDGDSSPAFAPAHSYRNYGCYNVTLTAFNITGCSNSITKVNYIHTDSVKVGFNVDNTFSPCPPFACVMHNTSAPNVIKYSWDFGDGYTDTVANPTHIYFYPGVYTIKLRGYTREGCGDSSVQRNLITVQGPTGSFNLTPKTGCAPLQVVFSAVVSSNTRNVWCDLGDGTVISDSLNFTHVYTSQRVFHPQFILKDYVGCTVPYVLDSIITLGNLHLNVRDTSVCAGTPVELSLGSDANSYQWTPSDFLPCDTCGTVIINAPGAISYAVIITNRVCNNSVTVHVNVEALPVLKDSLKINLCKNDAYQLFAGNANRLSWSPSLYLSDSTSANPVCTPLTSIEYTVKAYNQLGCSARANVDVTVHEKVSLALQADAHICSGALVQLNTQLNYASDLGVQYKWSPAQYLNSSDIASPVASMTDSTLSFRVIANSGHCIADTGIVTVYVNPVPVMSVAEDTSSSAEITLRASSIETLSYTWVASDFLSCSNCSETILYPSVESQMVYVEGIDQLGCIARDSINVVVNDWNTNSLFIPNAFTPNGDGKNDVFEIYGQLHNLKYLEVRIFNRWGEEVFESNTPHFKWDGTYKGVMQNPGVYTWEMELAYGQDRAEKSRSGSITLLR